MNQNLNGRPLNSNEDIFNLLDSLAKVLHMEDQKSSFCIVGTSALQLMGLPFGRTPKDLDVEIRCEKPLLKHDLELLEEASNIDKLKPEYQNGHSYTFFIKDYKVNVFLVENFTHIFALKLDAGYYIAPIASNLMIKFSFNRTKDIRDLNNIIGSLIKLSEPK